MKHVVILTNIPAPYRVDFFDYLKERYIEDRFTIIYSSKNEDNRSWVVEEEKLKDAVFLDSATIAVRKRFDTTYLHIPKGVQKVLKELKPDVVVGSEYNPTVLQALRFCRKHRIPFVSWTDGTLFSERNRNFIQKFLRTYVVARADAYIGSSTKSKEAQIFYGADEKKCHISFLAVDVEQYLQQPQGKGTGKILCVGSLIERKGIDLLFRALSHVESPYELYLAGNGSEKQTLQDLAKRLKIEDRIHFLGQLSKEELLKHYGDSDLFVLPTREDCFALVILEAMCAGLPIVCSRCADGAYDLIENGKNGLMVDPYDEMSFADALEKILQNEKLRKEMGSYSLKMTEKFRFSNISKGYMDAIEQSMRE